MSISRTSTSMTKISQMVTMVPAGMTKTDIDRYGVLCGRDTYQGHVLLTVSLYYSVGCNYLSMPRVLHVLEVLFYHEEGQQ